MKKPTEKGSGLFSESRSQCTKENSSDPFARPHRLITGTGEFSPGKSVMAPNAPQKAAMNRRTPKNGFCAGGFSRRRKRKRVKGIKDKVKRVYHNSIAMPSQQIQAT